jgi:hypothetical protein
MFKIIIRYADTNEITMTNIADTMKEAQRWMFNDQLRLGEENYTYEIIELKEETKGNKVVSITYWDNDSSKEYTTKAVIIKETPKTMKLHFKNSELFGRERTLKKENILYISELDKQGAIEFCESCSDLNYYVKYM